MLRITFRLDVGLHKLRCHQAHRVSEFRPLPRPIMSTPHASMPTRHGGIFAKKLKTSLRVSCLRNTTLPARSTPCAWNTLEPNCRNLHRDAPSRFSGWLAPPLWHLDATSRRGRPFHYSRDGRNPGKAVSGCPTARAWRSSCNFCDAHPPASAVPVTPARASARAARPAPRAKESAPTSR